jgi:hypothetical protein
VALLVLVLGLGVVWWIDRRGMTKKPKAARMVQVSPGVFTDIEVDNEHWKAVERLKRNPN